MLPSQSNKIPDGPFNISVLHDRSQGDQALPNVNKVTHFWPEHFNGMDCKHGKY